MRKKKGLLIIMDGLGDRPIPEFEGKTPLEAAYTPHMDKLAQNGICGGVYPICAGLPVGTDVGHLHIFGYNSDLVYRGRGPLEALSAGIELADGDVAFRGNFATIDDNNIVVDRRAGRIREGTNELASALNGMQLSNGVKVLVKELTEHRVAVVLRREGLSDAITTTDPGTGEEGEKICHPTGIDNTVEAQDTANALLEFTQKCHEILKNHPLNKQRQENNLYPANIILTRGAGMKTAMPSIYKRDGIRAVCIAGDQTVGGIAHLAGMDYYQEESFTGSFDTNLHGKGLKAIEFINSGKYDWIVIHCKATDLAGHDSQPQRKKEYIEKVDIMIGEILSHIDLHECYVSITADHSTPCCLKDHSGDSVPTLISGGDVLADCVMNYNERSCREGILNNLTANDIYHLQLSYMGFMKKRGS